MMSYFVI